jgi:hypothetical protein
MNANSTFYRVVDSSRVCRDVAVQPRMCACPAHGHRIQKGVMGLSPATSQTGKGTPDNFRQSGIRNRLHGASAPKPASGTFRTPMRARQAAEGFSSPTQKVFTAFITQYPLPIEQGPKWPCHSVSINGTVPSLIHKEMRYDAK